jgi:hypothetical protein
MLPISEHDPLAPLLTPKALCAQLSISPRTYSRLVRAGMPPVWVLTARRYDVAEVVAWLRVQTPKGARVGRPQRPAVFDDQMVRHLKLLARRRRA